MSMEALPVHSSMPAQDERACGDDVVLSTRNRLDIVIRRTRVEVASFAAKRDKPPDTNVDACTEIENAAREFPRGLIGTAIDSREALLIIGVSAAADRVR
jgi:hypothetical protein